MPKVYVKATKGFFDRANSRPRVEDEVFLLKGEVAKDYIKNGLVEETEAPEKPEVGKKREKATQTHTKKRETTGPGGMGTGNIKKK